METVDGVMQVEDKLAGNIQDALRRGVLKQLPLTFLPYVNQQLTQWSYLFPRERQAVESLLLYLAKLNAAQSGRLFHQVVALEEKMGVRHWHFSTTEQTIENSSELARSPYFQEWRRAVQAVFDEADQYWKAIDGAAGRVKNRLVLIDIPHSLSLDSARPWRRWQGIGRPLQLDSGSAESSDGPLERMLTGRYGTASLGGGLLDVVASRRDAEPADTWVVDAGSSLVDAVLERRRSNRLSSREILLSYERLGTYRERFSHEMNTMHKDLADADAVYDRLRKVEVTPWCPEEVISNPAVREFVRSLYLSGNGAVIFGNSFVEWAASEAFRRARPALVAARFGLRKKPKPFTGVAVFDNPDKVNPLPSVDDVTGSAADAQMLALYVWLAASRLEEYRRATVCVCVAEGIAQAYIVAPPEFIVPRNNGILSFQKLEGALTEWMS